jgi:CubicO group peptidase (beta-lactamase class C family)
MPGSTRSLPVRPSLRYLKLEAKRRLAGGEFASLHDAQAAIAREHGATGWTSLRQLVEAASASHALAQVRWVTGRFGDAGQPGWVPPGEAEIRDHFSADLLALVPAGKLVTRLTRSAADLRGTLVVVDQAPLEARVRIAGLEYAAAAEPAPPHRLTVLQGYPIPGPVADPRVAVPPPARLLGAPPAGMAQLAGDCFTSIAAPGLALAGGRPGAPPWVVAKGWADLEQGTVLDPGAVFPAPGVASLAATVAVLRLVADGRVGLGQPASQHLRTLRLADPSVTVSELLTHTGGLDPFPEHPADLSADHVPDLASLLGEVIGCDGPRGRVVPSNTGCAVLGQLAADVLGIPYGAAVTRLVLDPLGVAAASFPLTVAALDPGAVTGYEVSPAGAFAPVPAPLCTLQAAGGLWAPAADVVRLAAGWPSLLPAPLARQALTPQAADPGGLSMGFGWIITPDGLAVLTGVLPGAAASLYLRIADHRVHLTLATRQVPTGPVDKRVMTGWASQPGEGVSA